jgi:hypothetical protein
MDYSDMGFDEALARLIQTDPKELSDHKERVEQRAGATKRNVEEAREEIRRGGQREPRKRFRL